MALKFKYQSKDKISAQRQSLCIERDGAWVLDVEAAADKGKLEEFRANNIALSNDIKVGGCFHAKPPSRRGARVSPRNSPHPRVRLILSQIGGQFPVLGGLASLRLGVD